MSTHLIDSAEELQAALRPFAALAHTGFIGSIYESASDDKEVMRHYASGLSITVGDFRRAIDALAHSEGEGCA